MGERFCEASRDEGQVQERWGADSARPLTTNDLFNIIHDKVEELVVAFESARDCTTTESAGWREGEDANEAAKVESATYLLARQ